MGSESTVPADKASLREGDGSKGWRTDGQLMVTMVAQSLVAFLAITVIGGRVHEASYFRALGLRFVPEPNILWYAAASPDVAVYSLLLVSFFGFLLAYLFRAKSLDFRPALIDWAFILIPVGLFSGLGLASGHFLGRPGVVGLLIGAGMVAMLTGVGLIWLAGMTVLRKSRGVSPSAQATRSQVFAATYFIVLIVAVASAWSVLIGADALGSIQARFDFKERPPVFITVTSHDGLENIMERDVDGMILVQSRAVRVLSSDSDYLYLSPDEPPLKDGQKPTVFIVQKARVISVQPKSSSFANTK